MTRLVLLSTSPRVAAGLLSFPAWQALSAGPIYSADPRLPLAVALSAAELPVHAVDVAASPAAIVDELLDAARRSGTATWLVGPDGDQAVSDAVAERAAQLSATHEAVQIEFMDGSWDVPGARLLDVVTTMDRLRSPGGCPWDAQQDHESLAPYLLEEAYEAFQAIEDGDLDGLRGELGDVLLQVAFHARLAQELPEGERWSIDDVATSLVDKLVRRHPHVFGNTVVDGADAVNVNWEAIKAVERGDASVVANVPLAAPALTLAATLQRKAARAGMTPVRADVSLRAAVDSFDRAPSAESAGELLWAAVETMCRLDIDAEAALRARAREFRDQVTTADGAP